MEYQPKNEKYFFNGKEYLCPLDLAMEVIGGKLLWLNGGRSVGTKL